MARTNNTAQNIPEETVIAPEETTAEVVESPEVCNPGIEKRELKIIEKLQEEIKNLQGEMKKMKESTASAPDTVSNEPDGYDPWSDLMEIKLVKDNDRYKDDLFVGVNGHRYNIQRGVYVNVPRCVADVIEKSQIQDVKVAEMIEELSQKDEK